MCSFWCSCRILAELAQEALYNKVFRLWPFHQGFTVVDNAEQRIKVSSFEILGGKMLKDGGT
jgi:hypothetical protein